MNSREAASTLDVTRDQIARLAKAGKLPGSRLVKGRWTINGISLRKLRRARLGWAR